MLSPGARVGPYEVTSPLGSGGMGEVYRAQDTKLGRDVALKVLPEGFTVDADRLARFEREAKVLASLNHPHIAQIYGLEEADGQKALVLELIEGPTLADRIAQGPIPLDEALPIARQIAEALEAAHEQGIIHRDLKPANVKVKPDGTVKVLDFGLAKAFEPEGEDPDASQSPTLTARATQMGVILGTAAYMAPEQARGRPVDKRADIWAFGVVLYEMLTGQRAFTGSDVTDTLASVLRSEPEWAALPASMPPGLQRLLRRCLEKAPRDRLRDIGDARLGIEDAAEEETETPLASRPRPLSLPVAAFAVGLAIGAALTWTARGRSASPGVSEVGLIQLTANPPENTVLSAALSPDGKLLAFADLSGLNVSVTATGETHAVPVPEDLDVDEVDWFPDGGTLLLGSSSSVLWKMSAFGGTPRRLADEAFRAVVSPDGTQVAYLSAVESPSRQVYVMGAEGQDARTLADGVAGEAFWELAWSPDGAWLLVGTYVQVGAEKRTSIQAVRVETGERHATLSDPRLWQNWRAVLPFIWTPSGKLVYARQEPPPGIRSSNLWSVDIDSQAVIRGTPSRLTQLQAANFRDLSQTTSGRIAFLAERNQSDVYVADLPNGIDAARLVTVDERDDYPGAWLPDGEGLVLLAARGEFVLSHQDLGSGESTLLASKVDEVEHVAVSGDGASILYRSSEEWSRVPIQGGPGELFLRGGERIKCAARAERCLLGERDEASMEYIFSELDPVAGEGPELARISDNPPFTNWDVSPDGGRVAITHNDGRVRLLDIGTGSEHVLQDDSWFFGEFVSFAADGNAVFVDGSRSGRAATARKSLLRVSLDPEIGVEELRSRRNVWHVLPKASPDGRRLAFGAMTFTANAWMISDAR